MRSPMSRPGVSPRRPPSAASSGCGTRTGRLARAVARPDHDRRSGRSLAGDHGREHLLPAQLRRMRRRWRARRCSGWPTGRTITTTTGTSCGTSRRSPCRRCSCSPRMRRAPCSTTGIDTWAAPAERRAPWLGGAMYPWESCPVHGDEVTPGARPYTEDHVSLDIALAFASYVHATGDMDYARRIAWPVLRSVGGVRRVSRVTRTDRGFEIRDTVGPREHYEPVANNAYTNMAAATTLRQAGGIARRRSAKPRQPSGRTSPTGLVLPQDTPARGDHQPRRSQARSSRRAGCRRARPASFRWAIRQRQAIELATYRYAAVEQAPIYVGAPMLSALAAGLRGPCRRAGPRSRPPRTGFGDFINEPFLEPDEYPRDANGSSPCFADVRQPERIPDRSAVRVHRDPDVAGEPETWAERPVALPEGWKGIHVERISVRGAARQLDALGGADHAALTAAEG